MAFKILSLVAILTAILYLTSQSRVTGKDLTRKSGQPTKHGEVYRAKINHRELIDRGLTRDNGEDLQVYYHANGQHPVQIDRVLSGLGTKSATVQFRLQALMSANTVDHFSYSLVLGSAVSGSVMDNPDLVYAFHDDFSSSALKKEWATNNYGTWSVQKGRLLGNTMQAKIKIMEIGLYVKSGFTWKDVEVELDLMETGTKKSAPGPFCASAMWTSAKPQGGGLNTSNPILVT
ncbi:hypothetical protein OS493_030717 [Desmophyllum pertusum]|uniref:Uncharacterized protein n=1 Tax=Desmophyllum pertusum TaxID=174260 RepID=A0A9W9Z8R8_9CNID|nr:hypothetical protein OS493_030717 [Desmophyllum pertusum]